MRAEKAQHSGFLSCIKWSQAANAASPLYHVAACAQGGIFLICHLAITPAALARLPAPPQLPLVHMAYTLEPNGALTRVPSPPRGGLMGLRDRGGALRAAAPLCRAIVSECRKNGYRGVLADLDPAAQARLPFLTQLSRALIAQGRVLYCPMQLPAEGARLLVGTAVSGGSLRALLESAANRFGAERLALDLERVRMDFPLPCPTGCGTPLKAEELDALRRKAPDAVFYSRELTANYFTYPSAEGTRFVLFDDAQTLRKKCALAASLGIGETFVMYPEVADLL